MKRNILSILFFVLSLTLLNIDHTKASTVLELSFDKVCQDAEFVFEGMVISKETRSLNGKPFTYFTFQIIEVIKGSYIGSTVELGFMGGQSGDSTLKVSGMRMPEEGERGIYFVENLSVQQVHPLCGWQQGHYLVLSDQSSGVEKVVPVQKNPSAMTNVLTLNEFKQAVRDGMEKGQ